MRTLIHTLLFVLPLLGLSALAPESSCAQTDTTQTWKTVEHFDGEGKTLTEAFTVEAKKWRIKWTDTTDVRGGWGHVLQIYVKRAGENQYETLAVNEANEKSSSGTSGTWEKGRYRLRVGDKDGDWTIKVQVPE